MTGVELIITALTAGAAAGAGLGAKDTVASMIADAYQGLKRLVKDSSATGLRQLRRSRPTTPNRSRCAQRSRRRWPSPVPTQTR